MKLLGKFNNLYLAMMAALTGVFCSIPAWASTPAASVDDIYAAVDFSGISDKVIPMAVLIIGVGLVAVALVIGGKYLNRAKAIG